MTTQTPGCQYAGTYRAGPVCMLTGHACLCADDYKACLRRDWAMRYQEKLDNYNTLAGIMKDIHAPPGERGEIAPKLPVRPPPEGGLPNPSKDIDTLAS